MFEILALKEFTFACLDDRNILYFQGHDDTFVYCENVIHYQAQKNQLLRRQIKKAISMKGPHQRDFYARVSQVVHMRAW